MSKIISLEGFESTMMDMFHEENPHLLDDDLADAFSDWISNQSLPDIVEMAEVYCYKMGEHKQYKQLAEDYWTKNFGALPTEYDAQMLI